MSAFGFEVTTFLSLSGRAAFGSGVQVVDALGVFRGDHGGDCFGVARGCPSGRNPFVHQAANPVRQVAALTAKCSPRPYESDGRGSW